jgi:L-serine dehydratase
MLSVLDIFKIGIGPSSSHTVGPMLIAKQFLDDLMADYDISSVHAVKVNLYGSLAFTGPGHGTDRATVLGLMGFAPDEADPGSCERALTRLAETGMIPLHGGDVIGFNPETDIRFRIEEEPLAHPNGMRLSAFGVGGQEIFSETYFSLGGGFTCRESELGTSAAAPRPPEIRVAYPFSSATDLLNKADGSELTIADLMFANEDAFRARMNTLHRLDNIWRVMNASIERGLKAEGMLPGKLKVRRRAGELHRRIAAAESAGNEREAIFDWLNAYAMAVNEENAAGGQVVTAPTNGAAGIIPAVIRLYCMGEGKGRDAVHRFLLTAGAIGMLYKAKASISGAEMGCQGEVGVACSMAAAGLVAAWGGTNEMAEHAAEIGMEHNLGLTCDPVGGLVQIPCIERNAIGAVKAVNAARLAMHSTGPHLVSLDQVIETMRQTGLDMNSRYKETSQGGLAVNVVEC